MFIRVLGSGAGGGFPQWNCNCPNCHRIRRGAMRSAPRTQSSIAVSGDGRRWVLFNASPDIRTQLEAFPSAWPRDGLRDSGIGAVFLIDAQIDHTTGLLVLRESTRPLDLWCSEMVRRDLTGGFPILTMLQHYCGVNHHEPPLDGTRFVIPGIDYLDFACHPLKSKAPPYSPHRHDPHDGDNIGVTVTDTRSGRSLYYAPGLGEIEPHVDSAMRAADCVLVDGTFWRDDEMILAGIGHKTSREIGHLPQSGPGGMIEALNNLKNSRKILIHINNTNPILDEDSPERAELTAAGIEVSFDGLEITL